MKPIEDVVREMEEKKRVRKRVKEEYLTNNYSSYKFKILALLLLAVFITTAASQKMPLVSQGDMHAFSSLFLNTKKGVTGFSIKSLISDISITNNNSNQSNKTVNENKSILILNPQSYPYVLGNWTVHFITKQDHFINRTLTIRAVNGTFFEYDIRPIKIFCENTKQDIPVYYTGAHLTYTNWTCKNATLTLLVLSSGRHNLKFEFNNDYAYAHNYACNDSTRPIINDNNTQFGYEGKPYMKYMNVTDPNGLPIVNYDVYVSVDDSFTIQINNQTGLINFTPTDSDFGGHDVDYKAWNNQSCEGIKPINFYIYDKPNITSNMPNKNTVAYENTTKLFNVSVLDRNSNNNLTYYWYYDGNLLPAQSGINKSTVNISFSFCSAGIHNLTVTVNNSYNLSTSFSWNISVINVDRAPVFNLTIQNFTWAEDSNITNAFNLSNHFFDYDVLECGDDYLKFNFSQPNGSLPKNITILINNQSPYNVSFYSDKYWFGNRTIVFYAYDSAGKYNVSNELLLNVSFINHPPSIGYNNKSIYKGDKSRFQINATDPDLPYDSLNFSYTLLDSFPEFSMSSSGLINFTAQTVGNHSVNITVEDSHGAKNYRIVGFSIINNSIPYFNELPSDVSLLSNDTYSYQINASDNDNDSITYSVSSSNDFPSLSVNSTTGLMSFALTKCDVGVHTVTVTIADSHNATNQTSFKFNVTNIPSEPKIQDFSPKHTRINKSFSVLIKADDADFPCPGDNLNFALNSTYSNRFSITNLNNSGNFVANFTAFSNDTGNYSLKLTVTDSYGLSDTLNFVFEFTKNHPPSINEDNITANATEPFVYQINATDYDNDKMTFNYSTNLSDFYMDENGLINFTPTESDVGLYTLELNVSDSINTTEKNITLNITLPNLPPNLFVHDLNATVNDLFSYQVNASDPNNDSLTFSYAFVGNNLTSFYMNSTGFINFTPSDSDIGNYILNVSVTDSHQVVSKLVNFTVYWRNHAPEIIDSQPANLTINESTSLTFNITVEDIDLSSGDNISVEWLVDGKSYNSTYYTYNYSANTTNQLFNYTFDYCSAGDHNITALVSDMLGNKTSTSWTITVNNVDRAPYFGIKKYYTQDNMQDLNYHNINFTDNNIKLAENDVSNYYLNGTFTFLIDFKADNSNYKEVSFDSVILNSSIPSQTAITIESRSSADALNWSDWEVLNNSSIPSESERYLQLRFNLSTNNTLTTPIIHNITVTYKIANVTFPQNTNPWWIDLDNFFYDKDTQCGDDYLNYSHSNTSVISVNIVNSRVQLQASTYGSETVVFTAVDSHNKSISSNPILITSEKVNEVQPRVIYSTSVSTSIQPMPLLKVITMNILNPLNSTMYQNNTFVVPIQVYNPSNETLYGIKLEAQSEEKVATNFDVNIIDSLQPNKSKVVKLTVHSYKNYPTYEILVKARVTTPNFDDSTKIMINSIQLGSASDNKFNTKITFTRDLLKENPECLELNEFIDKAQGLIEHKEYDKANALLTSVVRTCKYLITSKQKVQEKPSPTKSHSITILTILLTTGLLSLITIVLYLRKHFA